MKTINLLLLTSFFVFASKLAYSQTDNDTFTESSLQQESNETFKTTGIFLFPNPSADGKTCITLPLTKEEEIAVSVIDNSGSTVHSIEKTTYSNGVHFIDIDKPGLAKGLYFVKIFMGSSLSTLKLVIK